MQWTYLIHGKTNGKKCYKENKHIYIKKNIRYNKCLCLLDGKGKAVPLQAWSGPEVSRKLRFPDYVTTAQDGGRVVSLTHRPFLSPGNTPGTHFSQRLSRSQGYSAIGRIMSMKNSIDAFWNRTSDLQICSAAL